MANLYNYFKLLHLKSSLFIVFEALALIFLMSFGVYRWGIDGNLPDSQKLFGDKMLDTVGQLEDKGHFDEMQNMFFREGQLSELDVKESLSELKKVRKEKKEMENIQKLDFLILAKSKSIKNMDSISKVLHIKPIVLCKWIWLYKNSGITLFLTPETQKELGQWAIDAKVREELRVCLWDKNCGLENVMEVRKWLWEAHCIRRRYKWLRIFLITEFGVSIEKNGQITIE